MDKDAAKALIYEWVREMAKEHAVYWTTGCAEPLLFEDKDGS